MPGLAAYLIPGVPGTMALLSMSMAHRLRTVPIWSAWYLPTTFSVSSILLGASVVALILVVRPIVPVWIDRVCLWMLGLTVILFLTVQVLLFSLWLQRIVSFAFIVVALHEKPLKGIPTLFWTRFLSAAFGLLALTGSAVLGERWLEPGILFTVGAVAISEVAGRLVLSQVRMPEHVE
jgi:DMSO reductase anchor subunit